MRAAVAAGMLLVGGTTPAVDDWRIACLHAMQYVESAMQPSSGARDECEALDRSGWIKGRALDEMKRCAAGARREGDPEADRLHKLWWDGLLEHEGDRRRFVARCGRQPEDW